MSRFELSRHCFSLLFRPHWVSHAWRSHSNKKLRNSSSLLLSNPYLLARRREFHSQIHTSILLHEETVESIPFPSPPISTRQFPRKGETFEESATVGDSQITKFETGKIAKFASGAVVASIGDTKVLCTAVCSYQLDPSRDFLPLQVDYREKQYAVGKIPNTFMRREGAPKEREILCSRVIDRSIRPLFPKGFFYDTQVMANVLCCDGEQDPDVLAINAASASLTISDIPWDGPIGAVRIGRINGKFIVNPTMNQLAESDLNLIYACKKGKSLMIETQAREISNVDLIQALQLAHAEAEKLIQPQILLGQKVNQQKRELELFSIPDHVLKKIANLALPAMKNVLHDPSYGKYERGTALSAVQDQIQKILMEENDSEALPKLSMGFDKVKKKVVRDLILNNDVRVDGRDLDCVRDVYCEPSYLSPLHGSSLFSRGNTQVLCTVTLGPPDDAQRLDSLVGPSQKSFMVHYYFPPFSINEVKQERGGLNRREVGHGTLAEKALVALLPPDEDFPYCVRITSNVLASDGSSSMATVCGGSLALMDAGIDLKKHVAGVSIGLVTETNELNNEVVRYKLLTDILGLEDHLGDMDFKIAGTRDGITAIQLDIKPPGIPLSILCESLQPAYVARCQILDCMENVIARPRSQQNARAPRVGIMSIDKELIGKLIGPQGSNIKSIQKKTDSRISVDDNGIVSIFARDENTFKNVQEMIESTVGKEIEVGNKYTGTVVSIKDFGAFIEFPGGIQGLLHVSELAHHRVGRVEDEIEVGQSLEVLCVGRDFRGNIKLSKKALVPLPEDADGSSLLSMPLFPRQGFPPPFSPNAIRVESFSQTSSVVGNKPEEGGLKEGGNWFRFKKSNEASEYSSTPTSFISPKPEAQVVQMNSGMGQRTNNLGMDSKPTRELRPKAVRVVQPSLPTSLHQQQNQNQNQTSKSNPSPPLPSSEHSKKEAAEDKRKKKKENEVLKFKVGEIYTGVIKTKKMNGGAVVEIPNMGEVAISLNGENANGEMVLGQKVKVKCVENTNGAKPKKLTKCLES